MRRRPLVIVFAVAAALWPVAARSAPECKSVLPGPLVFGQYSPLSFSPLDSSSVLTIQCPGVISAVITLSQGSSGTFAARSMLGAGSTPLQYNLYADAARTVVWGDGTGGSSAVTAPRAAISITVHGRVFPRQDVPAGSYADTIVVTLNF